MSQIRSGKTIYKYVLGNHNNEFESQISFTLRHLMLQSVSSLHYSDLWKTIPQSILQAKLIDWFKLIDKLSRYKVRNYIIKQTALTDQNNYMQNL